MMVAGSDLPRTAVLGVSLDIIDYAHALGTIGQWRQARQRKYITIATPYGVMLCGRDREMQAETVQAYMTPPDGAGVVIAANLRGYSHCERVTGPPVMLKPRD